MIQWGTAYPDRALFPQPARAAGGPRLENVGTGGYLTIEEPPLAFLRQ